MAVEAVAHQTFRYFGGCVNLAGLSLDLLSTTHRLAPTYICGMQFYVGRPRPANSVYSYEHIYVGLDCLSPVNSVQGVSTLKFILSSRFAPTKVSVVAVIGFEHKEPFLEFVHPLSELDSVGLLHIVLDEVKNLRSKVFIDKSTQTEIIDQDDSVFDLLGDCGTSY